MHGCARDIYVIIFLYTCAKRKKKKKWEESSERERQKIYIYADRGNFFLTVVGSNRVPSFDKKKNHKKKRRNIADWLITCAKSSLHRHTHTHTHTHTQTYTYVQLLYRCSCSRVASSLSTDFSCSLLFAYLEKGSRVFCFFSFFRSYRIINSIHGSMDPIRRYYICMVGRFFFVSLCVVYARGYNSGFTREWQEKSASSEGRNFRSIASREMSIF